MYYKKISVKERQPQLNKFVTTIDVNNEHRIYRLTENGWNMRDSDGTNSPNNNLEIEYWLEEVSDIDNNTEKSLDVTSVEDAKNKVSDIKVFGDGDTWRLICKASSESQGWMKSTKGIDTGNGVVLQVTTQQKNQDGSYAIAENVCFVPNVGIFQDEKTGILFIDVLKKN
jgi:hypothetical protein